jgi:antitoxin component HigA of HigAB toxin-antitoxin module
MESIDNFKKIAQNWLKSEKVIPNDHSLNLDNVKEYFKKVCELENKDSIQIQIITTLIKNIKHISFKEFKTNLANTITKFLNNIKDESYYIITIDKRKSNYWLAIILILFGKDLIKNYKDPIGIIDNLNYLEKNGCEPDTHYLLLDDAIFTGTQMSYNIDSIKNTCLLYRYQRIVSEKMWKDIKILKQTVKQDTPEYLLAMTNITKSIENKSCIKNIHIVCAYIGKQSINKIENKSYTTLYYGEELKNMIELLDKFDYELCNKAINKMFTIQRGETFKSNYMKSYPIYFDHKIPDAVSSFPTFFGAGEYISSKGETFYIDNIVKNCNKQNIDDLLDGSTLHTCVPPIYKKPLNTPEKIDKDI